jgi:hypothetical protein
LGLGYFYNVSYCTLAQDQLHLKGKVNGIYVINHRKAVITDGEGFDKRKSRDTLLLSAVQYKSSAKDFENRLFFCTNGANYESIGGGNQTL